MRGLIALRAFASLAACATACGAKTGLDVPDVPPEAALPDAPTRDATVSCAQNATLEIPATTPWSDTGIEVTAGSRIAITAMGIVRYGSMSAQTQGPDGGDYTGQMFFPNAILPSTEVLALIGKIGGTTAIGSGTLVPEGTPGDGAGFVGASYDEVIPVSGRLFLGYNDLVGAFGDNAGAFTVTIMVTC